MRVLILGLCCLVVGAFTASAAERSVEEVLGDWQILCFDEEVAPYRDCYVIRDALAVLIGGAGYELVIVGHELERQTGTDMVVRVDRNQPILWREDDLYADEAFSRTIQRFMAGAKAAIEWTDGQSGKRVGGVVSLTGFTRAYQRAKRRISDHQP